MVLAPEQYEASLADRVCIFFTEVCLLVFSKLVRAYYSYLLIGYYVPGTLLGSWYSGVSKAETNSPPHGIYIPGDNTDIKQQIIKDAVCWRVLHAL